MTIRDEEILNASTVYHEEQFHCDGWNYDFIEGAKWADQHPRKGLVDVDKACNYLKEKLYDYITFYNKGISVSIEEFVNEYFSKAMLEEEQQWPTKRK